MQPHNSIVYASCIHGLYYGMVLGWEKILKDWVNSKLFHNCGLYGGGIGGFLVGNVFLNPNVALLSRMASLTIHLFWKGIYFEK